MDKIQFNHSKETNAEKIGMSQGRLGQIFEVIRDIYLDGEDDFIKDIEKAVNELNPTSAAEYLVVGFCYADVHRQAKMILLDRAMLKALENPDA